MGSTIKQRRNGKAGKTKGRKGKTYAQLKKALDGVFSQYVRVRDLGRGCISCGVFHGTNGYQAGHFVSRVHLSTRWNEENVNAQCMPCNVWRRGNASGYAEGLMKKYGPEVISRLNQIKQETLKFSRSDLEGKIADYRARLEALT